MRPADTAPEAHRVQMAVFARMSANQKVRMAMQLTEDVLKLVADGIRRRHPDYDDDDVRLALLRRQLGDDLFKAAWPTAPLLAP